MITGPIFRVELVSAARRRRYFALRVAYSLVILFVLWVTYENTAMNSARRGGSSSSINATANAAAAFFWSFSWVQVIGILLVAPAMAVGTIATERERRTIEYLFATDLSNLEIVLGKTAARLLLIGQLVLASLPVLAGSFALCAIFVTAVGLLFSLRSKTSLRAMGLTLITVLFAGGGYFVCCCPVFAMGGGDSFQEFGFAPCLPFLVVAPAMGHAMSFHNGATGQLGELIGTFIAGIALYLVVCGVLLSRLVLNFDAASGRTSHTPDAHSPHSRGKRLVEG